jgi:hypothetical protein
LFAEQKKVTGIPGLQRITSCCAAPGTREW